MNREKLLIVFMVLAILIFFRGFFIEIISSLSNRPIISSAKLAISESEDKKLGALGYATPQLLSVSVERWGKDIFHDRSNIYDNKFKLTGITRFEDGYKAIINDDIVLEGERVQGFVVADINEKRVLLKRNKHRVTLKLEE